ncbi:ferrous iron transport protein B [Alkaliphilus oremlandii]|uniref:Ferrous iron transport protein B n=1 Tax=Alkaliphilus oremlandii (strain OhILAs) TaxID=350688 RepID=A8MI90_ALKOO|nr:ferrous iron transport protein B [Alkaliphilus oremlandii]ABW19522.1 GTP-binding protein HSR1-related [Alkaliphilus oremlandii OhILAs]
MGLSSQSCGKSALNESFNIKLNSDDEFVIALAGNPNVGKSTVFNALTGLNQHTGNWPGKTVSNARGSYTYRDKKFILVDLPGTYSLSPNSVEEEIARDFICLGNPDATIVVVDATCLERNLNLVLQIMEHTNNVVLCVNLMDEAKRKGIRIDLEALEIELGIPVIGTSARKKEGLNLLIERTYNVILKEEIVSPKNIAYKDAAETEDAVLQMIFNRAEEIVKSVITVNQNQEHRNFDKKLDDILTSKYIGFPIMFLLLGFIFWLTIAGANVPSQMLSNLFYRVEIKLTDFFMSWESIQWLHGILVLGVYRTLAWVISVMLPPMAIFFPLFTLLEDLGYLPRVAFNLDKLFKKAGAHGKQSLTMSMGFGCNAAGVIACRIIESPRERLIAILTNNFVPCNGRFPALVALSTIFIGGFVSNRATTLAASFFVCILVLLGIATTLLVSYLLSKTVLRGIPSSFTLELPPYRKPQIGKILYRSLLDRTIFVLGRAIAVAAPAGLFIWILTNIQIGDQSILNHAAELLHPFATAIGLDGFILMAFILGLPANEIVLPILIMSYTSGGFMVELDSLSAMKELFLANGWTWLTALNFMIFSLLHFPCGTTLWTIKKESGSIKWTLLGAILPTAIAVIVLFVITQGVRIFSIL